MRNDFETPKDARRYHTYHSTRKVWSYETRRKNQRLARTRLSDNHSVKRGYQPLRREEANRRVQVGEKMSTTIMCIGLIAMFVGMSIEDSSGAISKPGAFIAIAGILLLTAGAFHAERFL